MRRGDGVDLSAAGSPRVRSRNRLFLSIDPNHVLAVVLLIQLLIGERRLGRRALVPVVVQGAGVG